MTMQTWYRSIPIGSNFSKISMLLATALLLVTSHVPVYANDDLKLGGTFRTRYEIKQDFNFDDSKQDYYLTQLRLNLDYKVSDNFRLYIELQDARVYGEDRTAKPGINDDATPNIFADSLDFHKLFVQFKFDQGNIKLGRQKFNLGDKRLVASLEWVNTARVWDGGRLHLGDAKTRQVDFFTSKVVTVDPNDFNDFADTGNRYFDSDFHGVYATDKTLLADTELHAWWFFRHNEDFGDSVHTFGGRYLSQLGPWYADIQGSLQYGRFNGLDQEAFMFHAGFERSLWGSKVGVAYNLGSGDDDASDDKHETFDNLYPLNHAYYGFMDLFSLQNVHNFEATYKRKLAKGIKMRIAYQGFWLYTSNDSWYNAGLRAVRPINTAADSYVGSEIDLTLTTALFNTGITAVWGYSHFFAGSYLDDTGNNGDADFAFLQLRTKF